MEIAGVQVLRDQSEVLPVYDPAPLDAFLADLGSEGAGVRAELFEVFLNESTNQFVALVTAHHDAKGDVLIDVAHALRSAGAALGLVALSTTAAEIEIAFRRAPEQVNVALESTRLINEFQRATVAIGTLALAHRPERPIPVELPGTVPTVLVVEDDPVSQRACAAVLTKLGYNMRTVVNGSDALKELELHRYAAVLMDFRMPVLDGFLTTRELRHREGMDRHTPVIALTWSATEWDRGMCLEAGGMDEYLTKPIDVAKLTAALAYWVHDKTH